MTTSLAIADLTFDQLQCLTAEEKRAAIAVGLVISEECYQCQGFGYVEVSFMGSGECETCHECMGAGYTLWRPADLELRELARKEEAERAAIEAEMVCKPDLSDLDFMMF